LIKWFYSIHLVVAFNLKRSIQSIYEQVMQTTIDEVIKTKSEQEMDENKQKALQAALAQIERQFGKGSVMRLGDGDIVKDVHAIPTGSIGLDVALGIGGLPKGRVCELHLLMQNML